MFSIRTAYNSITVKRCNSVHARNMQTIIVIIMPPVIVGQAMDAKTQRIFELFSNRIGGPEKGHFVWWLVRELRVYYLELVYLVTALVPSLTACLASSPGNSRRTAVWISRLVMVERLL